METSCHAIRAEKGKGRKAKPDSRSAIILDGSPTPDYADRNTRRVLAVAVNSAQRVSRRQLYGYLLAANSIRTNPLVQVQGFPTPNNVPDLDGRNRFVTNGANARGFSYFSVRHAGDINGDSTGCLS